MDGVSAASVAAGGGGGGGGGGLPAPFLLKTYDMVDDSTTDHIVSWSPNCKSFVVWNPPEFARLLLPTYFKHNNFSSFIRQLNTYGFRKIDSERWEFANEDFVKDQNHLLKNIHRRKPIHSHSNPQATAADPDRTAFEEEIDKLSHERAALEANILNFKQQQSTAKVQLEDLTRCLSGMECRQENLLSFLEKAVHNPNFVEHLAQRLESMDVSAYNKKRRLPEVDQPISDREHPMVENHSSSKPELGFPQDFCNKLRLELSPAVSDINLLSHSTQRSNEDGESSPKRTSDSLQKDAQKFGETLYAPETLELSDTGTSFGLKMDSHLAHEADGDESPKVNSFQPCLAPNEVGDSHISCHLNLSLASSSLPVSKCNSSTKMVHVAEETGKYSDTRSKIDGNEANVSVPSKNRNLSAGDATSAENNKHVPASAPARVNDGFWEQFLTERPGSSDTEEASSNYRANSCDEPEARKLNQGISRNINSAQHLSL